MDRVAQRHSNSKAPVVQVDVFAAALLVRIDAAAVKALLGLNACVLHFFQFQQYRKLRPQVGGGRDGVGRWGRAGVGSR